MGSTAVSQYWLLSTSRNSSFLELSNRQSTYSASLTFKSLSLHEINFQLQGFQLHVQRSTMFNYLIVHLSAPDIDRVHIQPVVAKVFTGLTTILKSKQGSKRLPWEVFHGRTQLCSSWCLFITWYESCLSKCHSRLNWNIPKDLHLLHDYSHFMKHIIEFLWIEFLSLAPPKSFLKNHNPTNLLPKHVIWSFAASFQDIQLTTEA